MIGCIALYDFDTTQFKLKEWADYGEKWMTNHSYPPNTMGLMHSRKYLRFSNGKRKLEKNGYEKCDGVDFYAGGEAGTDYAWKLAAYYASDAPITYLCFDEEVISFNYQILEKLLIDLCQFCNPQYGIGYTREKKYGPNHYAAGYAHGLKEAYQDPEHGKENDRIFKWCKAYQYRGKSPYKTGDLRDIYTFNVLSQAHMDRMINGQRFENWVQKTPSRGQLKKISENLWTWWIEPENIQDIRKALAPSGMIICILDNE